MKILIVGFTKIKYMPYMNFYFENIDASSNEVHLLYWNRDLKDENFDAYSSCVLHEFRCYQEDDVPKMSKIISFAKYRRFVKNVIKKEQFDFILVLHSLPGVLISDVLKKKFTGKYIFDYRDSTYEAFTPFRNVVGQLVKNSVATFVSSDAFRRFLPAECEEKIFTSHNLLVDSLSHRDEKQKHGTKSEKVRIAFWGFIRDEEINKEIIRKIATDPRFELHYYGREQQVALNLKDFTQNLRASNVYFHGEYTPEQRYEFVRHTDIIHNVFNNNNMMLAMANKYYDAAIFYIPLLSMKGSFMAETAQKANIGFALDPHDDNFTSKLFDAYKNLDREVFNSNCDKELERVLSEYKFGGELIKKATSSIEREGK